MAIGSARGHGTRGVPLPRRLRPAPDKPAGTRTFSANRSSWADKLDYSKDPRVDQYMTLSPRGSKQSAGRYGTWCTLPIPPSRKQSSEPPAIGRPECRLLRPARGKDHINVFLYDGGIVPDPEQIITSGHNNKTARTFRCSCSVRAVPRAGFRNPGEQPVGDDGGKVGPRPRQSNTGTLLVAAAAWLPAVMIGLRCGGAGLLRQPAVRDFP